MDLLEPIYNNPLLATVVGALVILVLRWLWSWGQNKRDSDAIYRFMLASKQGGQFTFRSTQAISAQTRIAESRVEQLCSRHPKIRRNEREKQSWRLVE
jgi:hypothetical protein